MSDRLGSDRAKDEELLAAFARGDDVALGALAARYERSLLGVARGLAGGDEVMARDIVQSAWLRVIRYAKSFRGECAVRTWLYRVVVNEARRARKKPRSTRGQDAVSAPASPADARALSGERDQTVASAVEALTERRREVVLLCYHHGLDHEEVARVLAIPLGTVKSRLHAALADLRSKLALEVVR